MKRQTGKSFSPVCGASVDELKLQKNQHFVSHHRIEHHHPYQHHGRGSYGSCNADDCERYGNDLQRHAFQNHPDHSQNFEESAKRQHNTLSKAITSSLCSSSSSSTSWSSEPSFDNEMYFLQNKPQHSVSCSNLPEAGSKFQDEESNIDPSDSMFFSPHHQQEKHQFCCSGQPEIGFGRSQLHRCHSRSTEGLLQSMSQVCSPGGRGRAGPMEFYQLHKTTSLGQSLAFHDNAAAAGNMTRSKRAESSIQLPSKSILKNKDEGQKKANIRKAKSMEVLSTRDQGRGPQKHSSVETIKKNLVKEKLEFSAFLDELTRQIISPSRLSSFRISTTPKSPKPHVPPHVEHKLPTKPTKQGSEYVQRSSKQLVRSDEMKEGTDSSKRSQSRKSVSPFGAAQYHPHHHSSEKRPSTPEIYRITSNKENQRKYSRLLCEGSSTSLDSVYQQKNHQAKRKGEYGGNHALSMESHNAQEHKGSFSPARPLAVESESDLSKTSTTTASNTDNINKKKHEVHKRQSKIPHSSGCYPSKKTIPDQASLSCRRIQLGTPTKLPDAAVAQVFLEHYNKELHENLLQTVACIENMEAELQSTKTELNSTKEKYKRLQESYSKLQQTNNALEEKLQSVVDSMNTERKHHLQKTSELTKQLDAAKNTITSLENINVPSLIKELLDKHFHSQDALKNFLYASSPAQSDTYQSDRENQTHTPACSVDKQEDATASLPWRESQNPWVGFEKSVGTVRQKAEANVHPFPNTHNSCLHFTAVDPNPAIYRQSSNTEAKTDDPKVTTIHLGLETENHSINMK